MLMKNACQGILQEKLDFLRGETELGAFQSIES
jgi:hypothetical protein